VVAWYDNTVVAWYDNTVVAWYENTVVAWYDNTEPLVVLLGAFSWNYCFLGIIILLVRPFGYILCGSCCNVVSCKIFSYVIVVTLGYIEMEARTYYVVSKYETDGRLLHCHLVI